MLQNWNHMKLLLALRLVWVLARARTPIVVTDDLVRLTDRRSRREAMNGPAAVALPTLPTCHGEGYVAMFTKHNATITPPEGTTHGTTVGKKWSTFGQTMGESMQMLQLRVLLRSLRRHEHAAHLGVAYRAIPVGLLYVGSNKL